MDQQNDGPKNSRRQRGVLALLQHVLGLLWRLISGICKGVLYLWNTFWKGLLVTFVTAALTLAGLYYSEENFGWVSQKLGLPDVGELEKHEFHEQSELSSDTGKRIACFSSPEHRILINEFKDIPPFFVKAIIASEDQRFYEHAGVDYAAIVRAFLSNLVSNRKVSGASTLTMQIAKNLLLKSSEKTYWRKIREMFLARRIEKEFTKQELLLKYVNMPYLGRGQYGIEAASLSYFGKSAAQLSLEEVAMIVGLLNKPSLIDRLGAVEGKIPTEAKRRASYVIERMRDLDPRAHQEDVRQRYDSADDNIDKLRVSPAVSGCSAEVIGEYYVEEIRRRHKDKLALNTGGMRLFLPVDAELQKIAEEAMREGLAVYRSRYTPTNEKLQERHKRYLENVREDIEEGRGKLPPAEMKALAAEAQLSLEEFGRRHAQDRESIRGAAFGVDFAGRVRFLIGGEDFKKSKFNVATQGFRQPGSTFKAYTYAALNEALLEEIMGAGVTDPAELLAKLEQYCTVLDAPVFVSRGRGRPPKQIANFRSNSQPQYRGPMTCRQALAESRNTAAIRAGTRAGVKRMVELGHRLGLGTGERKYTLQPYPTTAIGASDVVPMDMSAYLSFVNGGYKVPLIWEYDVCKRDGDLMRSMIYFDEGDPFNPSIKTARTCNPKGEVRSSYERALHPVVAEHMKHLLRGVMDEPTGTAHSLRRGVAPGKDPLTVPVSEKTLKFPLEEAGELAGKTGTATNANGDTSDVWFIVLIPGPPGSPQEGMLMVFWMGKTTKASLGSRETGGRNLVPVAAKIMRFLQEKRGLLKPGHAFEPLIVAEIPGTQSPVPLGSAGKEEETVIDPSDPATDPAKIPLFVNDEALGRKRRAPEDERELD